MQSRTKLSDSTTAWILVNIKCAAAQFFMVVKGHEVAALLHVTLFLFSPSNFLLFPIEI